MRQQGAWPIIAALGLFAALPAVAQAPATPAAPTVGAVAPADTGTPVRGRVTAVDMTANTITLAGFGGQTPTILHVTPGATGTKYLVDKPGTMTDLKIGQTVRVNGQTVGNTVTARSITIIPPAEATQQGGGRRSGVQGVIATLTPALTITTTDAQIDTVQTDATTTVMVPKAGRLADIAAGQYVTASATGAADNQTAMTVHARAGGRRGGRRQGGGGNQGGATPAPAPAAPAQ